MNRPDAAEVAHLLAEHIETLAVELVGTQPTSRSRDGWRFRSRGSLAVVIRGQQRGDWFDHEAGAGGDALSLVRHLRGGSLADAYAWALGWLGLGGGDPAPATPRARLELPEPTPEPSATLPLARGIWAEGIAAAGTPVERYLRSRGLDLPADAPLRFHPACPRGAERWPAMLALMTDPLTSDPCGVHRTFLARDGVGKAPGALPAKMMAGRAGVIRLVPDEEVTTGLGLAEGIETGLAVMQHFGWRPVWACCSAGGIARFPVLAGVETLSIFADRDDGGAGLAAALACAERWSAVARDVRVLEPPEGEDFHDVAQRRIA